MQIVIGNSQREHDAGWAVDNRPRAHIDRPVAARQKMEREPRLGVDFAQADVRCAVLCGPAAHAAESKRTGVKRLPAPWFSPHQWLC